MLMSWPEEIKAIDLKAVADLIVEGTLEFSQVGVMPGVFRPNSAFIGGFKKERN